MKRKGGKLLAVILMAASVFSACGAEEQAQKEASDISFLWKMTEILLLIMW